MRGEKAFVPDCDCVTHLTPERWATVRVDCCISVVRAETDVATFPSDTDSDSDRSHRHVAVWDDRLRHVLVRIVTLRNVSAACDEGRRFAIHETDLADVYNVEACTETSCSLLCVLEFLRMTLAVEERYDVGLHASVEHVVQHRD